MLFYKDNKWNITSGKVKYTRDNKQIEQYVGAEGKEWWTDFDNKWDDMEVIEFSDLVPNEIQLIRLEEINSMGLGDGFSDALGEYVMNGVFPNEIGHILKDLEYRNSNIQQGILLTEMEINEMVQGMQITDIEIQLLELGGI